MDSRAEEDEGRNDQIPSRIIRLAPRTTDSQLRPVWRQGIVMATDVVGYSRLIEIDALGTALKMRRINRRVIKPLIGHHRGSLVDDAGDATLAIFDSTDDAVSCAMTIQRTLTLAGRSLPEERRIRLRIGVCGGELLLIGGAVYGTPVNVAARLQRLADPGEICVSEGLPDWPESAIPALAQPAGRHQLRNISSTVVVYRIRSEAAAATQAA